ncbi:MAG TPA: PilZ domain-containing protein [Candidatus Acidoferrum sp.]|nr:PilZ domain-containing protein [Candidatus Acidoferrum sp.]
MKRRKSKHNPEPSAKPLEQFEHDVTPSQVAIEPVPQLPETPANPAPSEPEVEAFEISGELQQEIENFNNSFHVQRHRGMPPTSSKAAAGIESPALREASAATPPPAAADRRANPRYAFQATAEVSAADSSAKSKTRVRDLSQQGCYLDTEAPLPLGTAANVRMAKGAKSLEVQGRVVYVQPGRGMGLMFTAVKPEHGGTLDVWINESRETSWLANNRRRSQRVLMKVPVNVGVHLGKAGLSEEETYTLAVSAHGALIAVGAPMYRGQRLTLSNPHTKDSLECVVAHIDKFPDEQVKVGVEFLLPNPHFWHVAFPPKDWSPSHPHAKSRPK